MPPIPLPLVLLVLWTGANPDPETPVPAGPPMEWAEQLPPDAPPPEFPLRDWEQRLVETYGPSPLSTDPKATSKTPSPPETTEDPDALTPEWKAFLALGTPPLAPSSRKREWDTGVFHKNYPTKRESPFASPRSTPTGSSSSSDPSRRPTRQPSPTSVLPQYAEAGPSHSQASREQTPEDPDLRGKQVHWERRGVTTLGTTHQFSSTSPPHAAPELPTTPSRDSARSPDMPGAMSLDASLCVPAQIRIALAQIADAIGYKTPRTDDALTASITVRLRTLSGIPPCSNPHLTYRLCFTFILHTGYVSLISYVADRFTYILR
jgi:hypothetical protein